MPSFCAVVGCGSRGDRHTCSFFRIPCLPKKGDQPLKTKRRMKWILALRRADLTEMNLKYLVVCDRHFISGRPAGTYDIENPDWVPSINMGYSDSPRTKSSKPHIEYIRSSIANKNETAEAESTTDVYSSLFEFSENNNLAYETMSSDENALVGEINSSEEDSVAKEDISLPHKYISYDELISEDKNVADEEMILSEENILNKYVLSELRGDYSEIHENMSSKKVQTDLTMIDLDNIHDAFKSSVVEVNQLKAKLKSLTGDILHLNEIYC